MSNTYLLTWNPDKWDFEGGYHSFLKQVNAGEKPVLEWRAANSSIQKGDVMYLMRLGAKPRGIILKGIALGSGHPSKHYDAERAAAGEVVNRVDVQFISAGDYTKGDKKQYQFISDDEMDANDIFETVQELDSEKKYTINYPAFRKIESYKYISKKL